MKPSHDALERDVCPVGDEMLGALYRSSEHGLQALIEAVPPSTRAMLALFCYRRSHLQPLALALVRSATSCTGAPLSVRRCMPKRGRPRANPSQW
jgi:hypothetical protein